MVLAENKHFAPLTDFHVVLKAVCGNSLLSVAATDLSMGIERLRIGQAPEDQLLGDDLSVLNVMTVVFQVPVEVPAQTTERIVLESLTSSMHRIASALSED